MLRVAVKQAAVGQRGLAPGLRSFASRKGGVATATPVEAEEADAAEQAVAQEPQLMTSLPPNTPIIPPHTPGQNIKQTPPPEERQSPARLVHDDDTGELAPFISVIGVGGAGGNAINNMIASGLTGVEFIAANTDAQALNKSLATHKVQLGLETTHGLGAGARPDVGERAANESLPQLMDLVARSHMVFITAGMGGGTGTGASSVIAEECKRQGKLTVGVVTKPFRFEGGRRARIAEQGLERLRDCVDALITIPNQNLMAVSDRNTSFAEAFCMADDVLCHGVRGVTDLIVRPGLVNLDFADVSTIMTNMGEALMGTGEAEGEGRAEKAAEMALTNPLLADTNVVGARGVLISIMGGPDMTLLEVDEIANRIGSQVSEDANIIFGSSFDETMEGRIRVSLIVTGLVASDGSVNASAPSHHPVDADTGTRAAPPTGSGYILSAAAATSNMVPPAPHKARPIQVGPSSEQHGVKKPWHLGPAAARSAANGQAAAQQQPQPQQQRGKLGEFFNRHW